MLLNVDRGIVVVVGLASFAVGLLAQLLLNPFSQMRMDVFG